MINLRLLSLAHALRLLSLAHAPLALALLVIAAPACSTPPGTGAVCSPDDPALACPAGSFCASGVCTPIGADFAVGLPDLTVLPDLLVRCNSAAECTRDGGRGDCCNGVCVDLDSEPTHCGGCGRACPTVAHGAPSCVFGACGIASCDTGFGNCNANAGDGCEADLTRDPARCGSCSTICSAGANAVAVCSGGACAVTCAANRGDCDANPNNGCEVDFRTDSAHCGSCGRSCGMAANGRIACVAGTCTSLTCNFGYADCNNNAADGCEASLLSVGSCGACGISCPAQPNAAAGCNGGQCGVGACDALFGDCDGVIVNGCERPLATDVGNCGACNKSCAPANANGACLGGQCGVQSCITNYQDCDSDVANGCESNKIVDPANCGACGTVCAGAPNSDAVCNTGACGVRCKTGYTDCNVNPLDGCEVDITTPRDCGACGRACLPVANGTPGCSFSACVVAACSAGYGNCDLLYNNGCETPTSTDINNCGACNRRCSFANATAACLGGQCGILQCVQGYLDCDGQPANGCEALLRSDPLNCGACGVQCPANTPACIAGSCGARLPSVLVVAGGSGGNTALPNVRAGLLATNAFSAVDGFNAYTGTPTLANLRAYDAVLVYASGAGFQSSAGLGDALADYYDGGGRVVTASEATTSSAAAALGGRFASGYLLMTLSAIANSASLGVVAEPQSPLMQGVTALTTSSAHGSGLAANGGTVVARWSNGYILVVRGTIQGRARADVNFYPGAGWTGDAYVLLKNALLF